MKRITIISAAVAALALLAGCKSEPKLNAIKCDDYQDMEAYFAYAPGCRMIVSGHRGGVAPGIPENSIAAFEHTLSQMPSFFEIDPRMTKDSVIVLMHDSDLSRTSNGTGHVKDYTYAELQTFNLKDRWGKETKYKIPKVEDVIKWSQGKTILNFDKKDVTRDVLIKLVNSLGAKNCIYTVHTPEDALYCMQQDPDAHLSAWMKDTTEFNAYARTDIPWSRYIVYVVNTTMDPANQPLYDSLHVHGIRCMISMSPKHDKIADRKERVDSFKVDVATHPDIVETDFPTDFIGLY